MSIGFLRKPVAVGRMIFPCFNFIFESFNHVEECMEEERKVKSKVEIHPLPEGRGFLSTRYDKIGVHIDH